MDGPIWMWGKVANVKNNTVVYGATLLEFAITMRTSCFNTDLASQFKLAESPLFIA